MKLSDLSVNRSITAMMIFVALLVLGFVSYTKMPLDFYPDIEFPVAVVITDYPDIGPKEVENTVTRRIEESLAGINNVSGPGMLDFESCISLEKLVLDNEICGMALRMVRGVEPQEDFPARPRFEELLKSQHLLISKHRLCHLHR